jgi:hypothetical protein
MLLKELQGMPEYEQLRLLPDLKEKKEQACSTATYKSD